MFSSFPIPARRPAVAALAPLVLALACALALAGDAAAALTLTPKPGGGLPPGRLLFASYGAREGLETPAALNLAQDGDGFLWVGTEDGLYRYDGARFQRFGLAEGLPSSYVSVLATAPDGGILAGTWGGLARWDGERFAVSGPDRGLPRERVGDIAADGAGLWIALPSGLYEERGGRWRLAPGWPGGEATAVWAGAGQLWAALGDRVAERTSGGWRMWGLAQGIGGERLDALVRDGRGRLWARGSSRLWVLAPGAARWEELSSLLPSGSARGEINEGRRGDIWIPTSQGIVHVEGDHWSVLRAADGLPAEWSRGVFEDREGSLWVAGLGVHRLLGHGTFASYDVAAGLPNDVVWCIWRDGDGQLWVGTDAGVARASERGWESLAPTQANAIRRIAQSADGSLWMGGSPAEVLRWDPRTKTLERFGASRGIEGRRLLCILATRAGEIFVATDGAGLKRFDPARRVFVPEPVPGTTPRERFSFLLEDAAGRLWATGEHGLARRENGTWKRFDTRSGLLADHVTYAAPARDGGMWVAYFEPLGIDRLVVSGDRIERARHLEPWKDITGGKVYSLGEDSAGRLWIGTARGVDVIAGAKRQHYGTADGMIGEDCDAMALLAEPDGSVWIGTSAGLSRWIGGRDEPRREPPRTVLLSWRLGALPPQTRIPEAPAEAGRDDNTFEARYAGLSFLSEQVDHEVRLVGLEDDWRPTALREVRYTALPPAAYRFEVRARRAGGAWSAPAAVPFTILPAWWETAPARLAAVLALALLIALAVHWRLGAMGRRTAELEQLVAARTTELEEANTALAGLSVTDPLTGLKNRRYVTMSLPEDLAALRRHEQARERGGPGIEKWDIVFYLVDIDGFKAVNDRYGHAAGDEVLEHLAAVLRSLVRDTDTLVRWGGEEFLVVARHTSRAEATLLAERIRTVVGATELTLASGTKLRLTCSVGFAPLPFLQAQPDALGWEDVVAIADLCLYAAKRSGRNAWVGVTPRNGASGPEILARVRADTAGAVAEGLLEVRTSLPLAEAVRWS